MVDKARLSFSIEIQSTDFQGRPAYKPIFPLPSPTLPLPSLYHLLLPLPTISYSLYHLLLSLTLSAISYSLYLPSITLSFVLSLFFTLSLTHTFTHTRMHVYVIYRHTKTYRIYWLLVCLSSYSQGREHIQFSSCLCTCLVNAVHMHLASLAVYKYAAAAFGGI